MRAFALFAAVCLLLCAACGGAYQPSRSAPFDLEPNAEINDEDVRKAFEARPQLPEPLHVAYYPFDPSKAEEVDAMLRKLPTVASVYRIPPLLVTGERRFQESSPWAPPRELSLKKLRLLAARARADVLIVLDRGYRSDGVNALAALDVLVLPVLFVPFLDNEVESYLEAYVIDTRNGYLYGHLTQDEKSGPSFATIYARSGETIAEEQWQRLRAAMGADLEKLLREERAAGAPRAIPRVEAPPAGPAVAAPPAEVVAPSPP